LTFIGENKDKIVRRINTKLKEKYGAKKDYIYYDVTNFYFEREEDEEAMRRILSNPVGQRAYAQKYNIPLSAVQENQPMQYSTVAVMDKFYADMNDPYSTADDDDDDDVYNDWDF
jgi:hypothetical protein